MPLLNSTLVAFLNEQYEKDLLRNFQVYDSYTPNFERESITRKFYSKYEALTNEPADPILMEKIKRAKYDTPRQKHPWPETENQCYGWFTEPIVPVDRSDRRFNHSRKTTDFINHYLKLKMEESVFPKDKFTGVPFKVQ